VKSLCYNQLNRPVTVTGSMQQNSQIILWRSPSAVFFFASTVIAISAGVAIAQQQWPYLLLLALAPLLWYFPIQTALGLFALFIPFEGITQLAGGTTIVWILGLLASGMLVAVGLLGGRFSRPPRTAIWWALFLFWGSVSVLWAVDAKGALHQLATSAALILFYLTAVSFRITENEFEWVTRFAIAGGCLAAMLAVYEYSAGINWATGSGASLVERGSLIVGETEVNPDFFGLKLIIPISLAVATFLVARDWFRKAISFCALAITVLALLLTMSRAALLSLLLLVVIFLVRLRLYRRLMPVVLLGSVLLAAMPSSFFRRIQEAGETGGAGRVDIWKAGLEMFKHYPIVGTGLGNFLIVYQQYAGYAPKFHGFTRSPHNTYLNVLVELGIFGLALFLVAVITQIRDASGSRRFSSCDAQVWVVAGEAAFCSMLLYGFFVDLIWDKSFWLSAIFLAFAIVVQRRATALPPEAPSTSQP
jgi:O-antigen ligase